MMFALRSKSRTAAFGAATVLGLFVCLTNLPAPAHAQGLTPFATMEANYSILVRDAEKAIIQ
jgi:hypothetical protein